MKFSCYKGKVHCVSKDAPTADCCNFDIHQPILVIFVDPRCLLQILFPTYIKKLVLLYTRGITHFLLETVDGSEKSRLVIADFQNDDLLRFLIHVFTSDQQPRRQRSGRCLSSVSDALI